MVRALIPLVERLTGNLAVGETEVEKPLNNQRPHDKGRRHDHEQNRAASVQEAVQAVWKEWHLSSPFKNEGANPGD